MTSNAEERDDRGPLLRVSGMSKTFPGLKALDDVSLTVNSGEIVAVIGHNGSGKSTLVKILAGVHDPDPGATIEVSDGDGNLLTGVEARDELHFIHQDLGLVDLLTTVENLALGRAARLGSDLGPVRRQNERAHARRLIARFGASFDPSTPVGQLTPAERSIVAIARALDGWKRSDNVLVLDEPTTAFHRDEVEILFEAVRRIARAGAGVIFISHRLDEVLGLADRVVVLRDGKVVANEPAAGLDRAAIVRLIVGRAVEDVKVARRDPGSAPSLEVESLSGGAVQDISFSLRPGEILGVSGVLGSGREDLASLLFGAGHRISGTVRVCGAELVADDIARAIESGLALVPADRRRTGAVMSLSARENLTLPLLRSLRARGGRLSRKAERRETANWIAATGLRPAQPELPLNLFSGGNQQKVVLAKWLRTRPLVLLLEEPTQGVDVGAQAAIYELILQAAQAGCGVLLCSSDVKELVLLSDRVIVLGDGLIVSEVPRDALTEERLIREELDVDAALPEPSHV